MRPSFFVLVIIHATPSTCGAYAKAFVRMQPSYKSRYGWICPRTLNDHTHPHEGETMTGSADDEVGTPDRNYLKDDGRALAPRNIAAAFLVAIGGSGSPFAPSLTLLGVI